jgi:hypothetical protein
MKRVQTERRKLSDQHSQLPGQCRSRRSFDRKSRRSRVRGAAHDRGRPSVFNLRKHLRILSRVRFEHPQFVFLFEAIGRCHYRSRTGERRRGFTITGKPGAGKTTLAITYRNCYRRWRSESGIMHIPVLYVRVPSQPTPRSFRKALLKAFGEAALKSATADDIGERLDWWMTHCRVQMILLDDVHNLVDRATSNVVGDVARYLREFSDKHPVAIIFFGLPHCTDVFKSNDHEQLRDRFGNAFELGAMLEEDGQALLAELDDAQPFPKVGLARPHYAERMRKATNFYPGGMTSIVAGAVENATWLGKNRLDEGDLWYGFERWIQTAHKNNEDPEAPKENPFSPPTGKLRAPLPMKRVVEIVKSVMQIPM